MKCFQIKLMSSQKIKMYQVILLGFIIATLNSCSLLTGGIDFDYEKFKNEKKLWINSNNTNYSYEYYSAGFTFENVQVTVNNNVITSVPINDSMIDSYNKTIDNIYAEIENRYLLSKDKIYPDWEVYLIGISITYDTNNFPTKVSYSYHIPVGLAVDGNFGFQIKNLKKL